MPRPTPRRQREPATFAALMVLLDTLPAYSPERWHAMELRELDFNEYGTYDEEDSDFIQSLSWINAVMRASEVYAQTDAEYAGYLEWKYIINNLNNNSPKAPSEIQLFTNFKRFETYAEVKAVAEWWLREV